MKKTILLSTLILGLVGCTGENKRSDDFITIDLTTNYPRKDMVLQDFMDVEYVHLETSDEFIASGRVAHVSPNMIACTNPREGDILLFDRATGKGIRKINRRGQGPEEYVLPFNVVLYENKNELFVNDGPASKIQVYDLEGNYKRTIPYKQGALVSTLVEFDNDNFLSQNVYAPQNEGSGETCIFLSKKDGSMTDIKIPYKKRLSIALIKENPDGSIQGALPEDANFIDPYQQGWVLTEPSSDTIYLYKPDKSMKPFIVRTPSVQSLSPEIFLFPGILTDTYYFMQSVTKKFDFGKDERMPSIPLVYDTKEKKVYECSVYNKDFEGRKENMSRQNAGSDIAFYVALEALELIEATKENKLKGKLAEISRKLDAEDNPVIMIAKPKK